MCVCIRCFLGELRSCILEDVGGLADTILGVYARDQPPMRALASTKLARNHGVIVNTDKSTGWGKHWICYFNNGVFVEFWDSYGRPVDFYDDTLDYSVAVVPRRYQNLWSDVCGQYCVFFLFCRVRGVSIQDIDSHFSESDFCANDNLVRDFVCSKFDYCVPTDNVSEVQCSLPLNKQLSYCYARLESVLQHATDHLRWPKKS